MPFPDIYILSGSVQSGKTTSLVQQTENGLIMHGILTPVIDGRRHFMNAFTRETWGMEAGADETDTIDVGRYRFSKAAFEKAIAVLEENIQTPGWLVLDEAGPLELKGEGFAEILRRILAEREEKVLLVIRETLMENIASAFSIEKYRKFEV